MTGIVDRIKRSLPEPIKTVLKPVYHGYRKIVYRLRPLTYEDQLQAELNRFNGVEEVNDLPEIFHYWSNRYLVAKFSPHGFNNPDEFFLRYATRAIANSAGTARLLSVGAGNCDTEIRLAKNLIEQGHHDFVIDCMDINEAMFSRGMQLARREGVEGKLSLLQADFNRWQADARYDLIIANQSLHHVVELEHLFDQVQQALAPNGRFVTSDVIGRNGHMRWPEALGEINRIWRDMPDRYRFNHAFGRHERKYINHDCSVEGFEGIRAQDILPLLAERFDFELFVPYANLILVFIDRSFGPNFDRENPDDLAFIDRVHALDEQLMEAGVLKPTQMVAAMAPRPIDASVNDAVARAIRDPRMRAAR